MTPPPFTPPMIGTLDATIVAVRPFTIHGDAYVELLADFADGDTPGGRAALRVPRHAYRDEPRAGDRVRLTFLMGQVTGVGPA